VITDGKQTTTQAYTKLSEASRGMKIKEKMKSRREKEKRKTS